MIGFIPVSNYQVRLRLRKDAVAGRIEPQSAYVLVSSVPLNHAHWPDLARRVQLVSVSEPESSEQLVKLRNNIVCFTHAVSHRAA